MDRLQRAMVLSALGLFLLSCGGQGIAPTPMPTDTPMPTPPPTPTPISVVSITGTGHLVYLLGSTLYRGGFSGCGAGEVARLEGEARALRLQGNRLAYALGLELGLLDLSRGDSSTLLTLPAGALLDTLQLIWSVGGEAIAYAVAYEDPEAPTFGRSVQVGVIDLPTGSDRVMAVFEDRLSATLLWYNEASGELILIPRGDAPSFTGIPVYDSWSQDQLLKEIPIQGDALDDQIALSPDGRWLALATFDSEGVDGGEIAIYDLGVAEPTPQVVQPPQGTHPRYLLWSPDGARLGYLLHTGVAYWDEPTEARGVWAWERGDGESRQIAEEGSLLSHSVAWSLDGQAILAYHHQEGGGGYYLALSDGPGVMPLDVEPEARVLDWVPGGG